MKFLIGDTGRDRLWLILLPLKTTGSYFMQELLVSRIHSICQQLLGNFSAEDCDPRKAEARLLRGTFLVARDSNLSDALSLNTTNFVCRFGPSLPQQEQNECARFSGSQHAPLWHLCSTKRKQELAQPWPCPGRGLL